MQGIVFVFSSGRYLLFVSHFLLHTMIDIMTDFTKFILFLFHR